MIDVHVIDSDIIEPDRQRLLPKDEFFKSLESEPVTVRVVNPISGNVCLARVQAFLKGINPYVSFVDDDDIVIPGTFQKCLDFLIANPQYGGVYTNSVMRYSNGFEVPMYSNHDWSIQHHAEKPVPIHQVIVIRRKIMEAAISKLLSSRFCENTNIHNEDLIYAFCAKEAPFKFLNFNGYVWYNKVENGFHYKQWNLPGAERERLRIKDFLLSVDVLSSDKPDPSCALIVGD